MSLTILEFSQKYPECPSQDSILGLWHSGNKFELLLGTFSALKVERNKGIGLAGLELLWTDGYHSHSLSHFKMALSIVIVLIMLYALGAGESGYLFTSEISALRKQTALEKKYPSFKDLILKLQAWAIDSDIISHRQEEAKSVKVHHYYRLDTECCSKAWLRNLVAKSVWAWEKQKLKITHTDLLIGYLQNLKNEIITKEHRKVDYEVMLRIQYIKHLIKDDGQTLNVSLEFMWEIMTRGINLWIISPWKH